MNKDQEEKKVLNTEEMEKVSGGTLDEYYAYMAKMREKYGDSFLSKMTAEEQALGPAWLFHHPGEQDPE